MAKLIVSTLTDVNSIVAFVANEEGVPQPDLGLENFKVMPTAPGSDGARLRIAKVAVAKLPGFYALDLATVDAPARRRGLYVFDLIVEKGGDRGQSLSSAIIS